MGDNRWHKLILTWSEEGGWELEDPNWRGKRKVERVMKQKNLIPPEAVNWQVWRKAT